MNILAKPKDDNSKEEVLKKLVELKSYLEARLRNLEEEAAQLRGFLDSVNEVVIAKSFQKVEVKPTEIEEQVIPLRNRSGIVLAEIYVGNDYARIVPDKEVTFDVDTPPFQTFLVKRIFESMQSQDREMMQKGEVEPDKLFSYEVVEDNGVIKEIMIKNYGNDKRLMELKSSVRWTFEKMYEKTQKD